MAPKRKYDMAAAENRAVKAGVVAPTFNTMLIAVTVALHPICKVANVFRHVLTAYFGSEHVCPASADVLNSLATLRSATNLPCTRR